MTKIKFILAVALSASFISFAKGAQSEPLLVFHLDFNVIQISGNL